MAKVQSTTAEAIAPWLDDVQHVSVESIETRTTIEWPSSLGINIEATALNASTYRGDQVVIERLAKFSANGSLAARFMFAGEPSIDALPTPSDWMAQSGITLRGGAHTAIAFAQSGGASFIRSGPRLLQIGYDTYGSSFPVSVEFPGGTRITEGGALGIGVGVPASALHVSSAGDQVRIEYPGGGFLGVEVGPYGNAQFSTTGGQSTFAGVLKTDTLNAGDVNVAHLHTSTQVLDSTLALSGFVGFSSVSGYVMADVVGGAWTEGSVIFTTTYDRDVSFVVAERVAEPGTQLFQVGQTVTFAWLVRDGGVETIQTLSVVIAAYDGRDPTVYPAQQTYTFHQHEESVFGSPPPPDPLGGGDVLVPKRAIASYGGLGALSMINGRPLLTMSGPTIGQWHDNYRGIKSENGHMLMSMGWIGAEGDDVEFIRVTDNYGDVTNFELTSSVGLTKGAKLTLKGGTLPSPTTRLAFDGGENTLAINASSLQVDGTAVTLSSVVPNTAPSAGQILVGNAGGTAYAPVSMSGDATLASTGALTIAANAVSLGKMAQMATASLIGRNTAGTGNVEVLSAATAKTLLSLNNVENTALSTWAGSSSITTVGTLSQPLGVGATALSYSGLYVYRGVTDPAATQYGQRTLLSKSSTTADSSLLIGHSLSVLTSGAGSHSGTSYGLYASAAHAAATVGGQQIGIAAEAGITVSGGSAATVMSLQLANTGNAGATITTRYGMSVSALDGSTVNTNLYCIAVQAQTAVQGSYKMGLYVGNISGGSIANYAIYTNTGTVLLGDNTGIGTYPSARLHVAGTTVMYFDRSANPANFIGRRVNGSIASPTQVLSGQTIASFSAIGYGAASFPSAAGARIQAIATEDQTTSATGMYWSLGTVATGGTTYAERLRIDSAGLTLPDAHDVSLGTSTGTKVGTSVSQKLGLWGATPVVQPASANQAAVSATAATQTTPWGFSTQAQADGIITLLNELRAALVSIGAIKGAA